MPGHRVVHQRAAAFVGNVRPFKTAVFAQQRHRHMAQAAGADAAVADVLFGFAGGHHIGEGFVFAAHIGGQHHRRRADEHQRRQVFFAVKRQVGNQRRVDAVRVKHHGKGVPISRRCCHGCRADGAGRAAFVVNNHRLAKLRLQGCRQNARNLVDRATRRKHGHQLDRTACRPWRAALRPGAVGGCCSGQQG